MYFTKAFWVKTLETTVAAAAAAFTGSLIFTTTPTWKGLLAAAVSAGVAALYTFTKQFGAVQALKEAKATSSK